MFQDPRGSLNPLLSVGAQLVEVLRAHLPLSRAAARARAAALLARVRIPDPERALAAYPHQFSGGQAQRIAIALAIAAGPRLLIADEVTSALDVLVQAEIVSLLRELSDDAGMTLLFITHDIALAGTLADRVAVLHDARLVEGGPAGQVIETPRDPYTRALLAAHLDLSSPRLVGSPRRAPSMTLLEARGLGKTYGGPRRVRALDGVSLAIATGRDARPDRPLGLRQIDARPRARAADRA